MAALPFGAERSVCASTWSWWVQHTRDPVGSAVMASMQTLAPGGTGIMKQLAACGLRVTGWRTKLAAQRCGCGVVSN